MIGIEEIVVKLLKLGKFDVNAVNQISSIFYFLNDVHFIKILWSFF